MLSFCISLVPSKSKHKFLNFVLISQLVIRFMNSESWSNIPVNLCYVPHQPILRVGWHSSSLMNCIGAIGYHIWLSTSVMAVARVERERGSRPGALPTAKQEREGFSF
jgi:hypothetical protein